MKYIPFVLLFLLFFFLEITITTIPLVLLLLLVVAAVTRSEYIFIPALFLGVFLDVAMLRFVGVSSVFFILFLFLIFLYERKFETTSYPFIFFAAFFGAISYAFFTHLTHTFLIGVMSGVLILPLFAIHRNFIPRVFTKK